MSDNGVTNLGDVNYILNPIEEEMKTNITSINNNLNKHFVFSNFLDTNTTNTFYLDGFRNYLVCACGVGNSNITGALYFGLVHTANTTGKVGRINVITENSSPIQLTLLDYHTLQVVTTTWCVLSITKL